MDLRSAIDALVDTVVDVIVGQFGQAAALHEATREQGETLRRQAATRVLLGARLDDAMTALVSETTRRAAVRYESCRRHPRFSSDQLVSELDNAEATLGKEIVAAQDRSSSHPTLSLALALIRVEAVSIAAGETPIAGRATPRATTRGPVPRRRAMTAADIPAELAQAIFAAARGGDMAAVFAEFRALEATPVNAGAVVTKVRVALERHGAKRARSLADGLREAGVVEVVPPSPEVDAPSDVDPASAADRAELTPSPRPSPLGAPGRRSIKHRIQPKQHGITGRPNGAG